MCDRSIDDAVIIGQCCIMHSAARVIAIAIDAAAWVVSLLSSRPYTQTKWRSVSAVARRWDPVILTPVWVKKNYGVLDNFALLRTILSKKLREIHFGGRFGSGSVSFVADITILRLQWHPLGLSKVSLKQTVTMTADLQFVFYVFLANKRIWRGFWQLLEPSIWCHTNWYVTYTALLPLLVLQYRSSGVNVNWGRWFFWHRPAIWIMDGRRMRWWSEWVSVGLSPHSCEVYVEQRSGWNCFPNLCWARDDATQASHCHTVFILSTADLSRGQKNIAHAPGGALPFMNVVCGPAPKEGLNM